MSDEATVRRFWDAAVEATRDARREHEARWAQIEHDAPADLLLAGDEDWLPDRIDAASDLADAWLRAADAWRAVAMAEARRQRSGIERSPRP